MTQPYEGHESEVKAIASLDDTKSLLLLINLATPSNCGNILKILILSTIGNSCVAELIALGTVTIQNMSLNTRRNGQSAAKL